MVANCTHEHNGDMVEAVLGVGSLTTDMTEQDQEKWSFMEKVAPWLGPEVINHHIGGKEKAEEIKDEEREDDVTYTKRKLSDIQNDVPRLKPIEGKVSEIIQQNKRLKVTDKEEEPAIQKEVPQEEVQEVQDYWNDKNNSNEAWVADEREIHNAVGKPQAAYHGNIQGHIFRFAQRKQGCPVTDNGWMSWGYVYKRINDPSIYGKVGMDAFWEIITNTTHSKCQNHHTYKVYLAKHKASDGKEYSFCATKHKELPQQLKTGGGGWKGQWSKTWQSYGGDSQN